MRIAVAFALFPVLVFAQPQARAPLPPTAQRAAELIGVAPLIEKLETLPAPAASLERLLLRQRILEAVVSASLDVDAVTSGIQNEWSGLYAVAARLRGQRDRDVDRLSLAGAILGIGGGIISDAMQLSKNTTIAGNAVGVAAGAAGTLVYALGLRARKGPEHHVVVAPAMLAPIFGQPTEPGCEYPPEVWAFLNTPVEGYGSQITRRELLIRQWSQQGLINLANPVKEREKIGFLTTGVDGRRKLSIQDLEDRMAMLTDLMARISLMKRDLGALMDWLRATGE